MKSVGEAMAIRWTLQESLQKAVRSLECGYSGWGCAPVKELDSLVDVEQYLMTRSLSDLTKDDFYESAGYETIMMNSNPETVSERPDGILVQFGGQTPLKLALPIQQYLEEHKPVSSSGAGRVAGRVRIWGTSPDSIDAAEYRERFNSILKELKIEQPKGVIAKSEADALAIAEDIDSHGNAVIGGIMEHIEQAGVHSGDSACILPTQTVSSFCLATIRSWTTKLAKSLNVCGLMNCQYAITAAGEVFLLEANPRASRTVPFVSKEIGHPLAKYAALVLSGVSLNEVGFTEEVIQHMWLSRKIYHFSGTVFISFNDLTKRHLEKLAKAFSGLGFRIISTSGTANFLELKDIPVYRVLKMHEGRPHAGDMLANGQIQLMVITSSGDALDQIDGRQLRRMALAYSMPIITTVAGALATAEAMKTLKSSNINMIALQDFFNVEIHEDSSKNLQSASSSL
ncbi:hypothetical protein GH714_003176 [Hevea brasiliensis]|uniref:carbamoyl-phosphate synthase (glutamine-hydrolyzing) n=1 Tax=Hevea brasiliensis TaxID=3981 RepID=A0A6A6NAH6_HEVBR|nr:hypothetical protein GH714_003176 [Hevea brasiliensis]